MVKNHAIKNEKRKLKPSITAHPKISTNFHRNWKKQKAPATLVRGRFHLFQGGHDFVFSSIIPVALWLHRPRETGTCCCRIFFRCIAASLFVSWGGGIAGSAPIFSCRVEAIASPDTGLWNLKACWGWVPCNCGHLEIVELL